MTVSGVPRPPAVLFGVAIDDLSMDETVDVVGDLVASGRRQGRTHQIATVNVDFLVNALADERVRRLLQRADLCLADGMPVVWGARASRMPLRDRVAGADLVPALAERAASTGWRIHLFGSTAGTAERSADLLRRKYPGVHVTADSGPIIADIDRVDEAVLASIATIDPDILCVALGNPKQERFIDAYRDRLRTPVMIGVGGTLDMLVGDKRRAPEWVQRVGMEWVVRAAQEPRRLGKRYAHDARVFFPRLASWLVALRRQRGSASLIYEITPEWVAVRAANGSPSVSGWAAAVAALEAGADLCLGVAASPLSVGALSELVGLIRVARRLGRQATTDAASAALRAQFDALGLGALLRGDHL
jgi:N-acetylglucosaminyldiphosphoundecaprenol N-acetyl-beta-D-mannosaminyltransferase